MQSNPMGVSASTSGRIESRLEIIFSGASLKIVEDWQHCKVPPLQFESVDGSPPLRTGVADAATLLTKAMVATKETRGLENRIVKDVWR